MMINEVYSCCFKRVVYKTKSVYKNLYYSIGKEKVAENESFDYFSFFHNI